MNDSDAEKLRRKTAKLKVVVEQIVTDLGLRSTNGLWLKAGVNKDQWESRIQVSNPKPPVTTKTQIDDLIEKLRHKETEVTYQHHAALYEAIGVSTPPSQWQIAPAHPPETKVATTNPPASNHQEIPFMNQPNSSPYAEIRKHLDTLVDKLLNCPSLETMSNLQQVVGQLPKDIQRKIIYPDNADMTQRLSRVVDACFNWPNGLELLIQRMAFFDNGTIPFNHLLGFLKSNGFDPKI